MNINEHNEHILTEEINSHCVVSNISDIIQYTRDMSETNENVIAKNVQDVHCPDENIPKPVREQPLIMPEHPNEHRDIQATCSLDVHCDSLTQPDEISSESSTPKAFDLFLTDELVPPKKTVPASNLTPFIC